MYLLSCSNHTNLNEALKPLNLIFWHKPCSGYIKSCFNFKVLVFVQFAISCAIQDRGFIRRPFAGSVDGTLPRTAIKYGKDSRITITSNGLVFKLIFYYKSRMSENVHSDVCARKFRLVRVNAQADQNLHWTHFG